MRDGKDEFEFGSKSGKDSEKTCEVIDSCLEVSSATQPCGKARNINVSIKGRCFTKT